MKIYYNEETNNVVLENEAVYFGKGSLEATNVGDVITIKYRDLIYAEHILNYDEVLDKDGNSAGNNVNDVMSYLDLQFNNNGKTEGDSSFVGVNPSIVINDNRLIDGDIIFISPQSVTINEIINTTVVVNNSFTVNRIIIDPLGSLTSNLPFKWIKLR